MKNFIILLLSTVLLVGSCADSKKEKSTEIISRAEQMNVPATQFRGDPWLEEDLVEPDVLANMMKNNEIDQKHIISIGFENVIKNSIDLGPANNSERLQMFTNYLRGISKDSPIVIYCGCCPFKDCPNIRPAMALVKDLQFENARLLHIKDNIRVDWIDKGYPVN